MSTRGRGARGISMGSKWRPYRQSDGVRFVTVTALVVTALHVVVTLLVVTLPIVKMPFLPWWETFQSWSPIGVAAPKLS